MLTHLLHREEPRDGLNAEWIQLYLTSWTKSQEDNLNIWMNHNILKMFLGTSINSLLQSPDTATGVNQPRPVELGRPQYSSAACYHGSQRPCCDSTSGWRSDLQSGQSLSSVLDLQPGLSCTACLCLWVHGACWCHAQSRIVELVACHHVHLSKVQKRHF